MHADAMLDRGDLYGRAARLRILKKVNEILTVIAPAMRR